MLTSFEWFSLISILCITFAGGYLPLFKIQAADRTTGFPLGQPFAVGVFLTLSLLIMLPAALHLLGKAFPDTGFPIPPLIGIGVFLFLLALDHYTTHIREKKGNPADMPAPPAIPVIMTIMIAIPSFFLGTALGMSESSAAVMLLIAILAHKGSAGFALALAMVRSSLTRSQTLVLYVFFACSTPFGIIVGEDIHQYISGRSMLLIKGTILTMASGTFLFMSTLHELKHTPMIAHCRTKKGYAAMLIGVILTVFVRVLMGEAHHK